MRNGKLLVVAVLVVSGIVAFVTGCKKDSVNLPLEPISLVTPDTGTARIFAGDSTAIEIKFTTDRPINWVQGLFDIDTTESTTYTATYPDTLFLVKLDTLNPRVNLYTYSGSYHVPDTLPVFSIVRFKVSFNAGKSTFTTGQNYPAGIVTNSKEFKINVR